MANVIFKQGTRAQYDAIAVKDRNTLYWLFDTKELFKGEVLYGRGTEATNLASGLMSAADKAKLDALSAGGAAGLTAVDASVILTSGEGGTAIGVQVSNAEGNAIELKEDGLFVSPASIKLDVVNANGLTVGDTGLALAVATTTTSGAMSAEDKAALDSVMASIVWGDLGGEETA